MRSPEKSHNQQGPLSLTISPMKASQAVSLVLLIALGWGLVEFARAGKASAMPRARLSQTISVHAGGRGNPSINMSDGRDVLTSYSGPAALTQALQRNEAKPLALASADFDEDGVPDLICGYSHSSSGIITWLRGNVDSIYSNSPEAQRRKTRGEFTDAPFLSPARVFGLPIEPDFLGAGDFDADGHWDVVAASRTSSVLYLLPGDGRGGFEEARRVALPGTVTALVTGEINRRDGLDDIVVAVNGQDGPKALVFEGPEGAIRAKPETFDLPAEASALALGQLDDSYEMDLAVAAGRELIVIHGRDRKLSVDENSRAAVPQASISRRALPFTVRSMAIGDFSGNNRNDVALLSDDGALHLQSRNTQEEKSDKQISRFRDWRSDRLPSGEWPQAHHLICARVSGSANDDLLVVDSARRQLHIVMGKPLDTGTDAESPTLSEGILHREAEAVSLDVEGEPAAVLPMRLDSDARNSLVVLTGGHAGPSVLLSQASMTFTVTTTGDNGANLSPIPGSLRAAIVAANSNPGTDTIQFNIPGPGVHTIALTSPLPVISDPVILDGTTQPGFAGAPTIELDGTNASPAGPGFQIEAGSTTVRGLVINRFQQDGIVIASKDNTVIEGNFIGTDASGAVALGNRFKGVAIFAASNILIGGTTASARNIVSSNRTGGMLISGSGATGNQVQGNFIGTDINGTANLGNPFAGVRVDNGATNNVIGGTTKRARNIISGNSVSAGVLLADGNNTGNLIQGNFIGTDVSGASKMSNPNGVLLLRGGSNNTIGGTVVGARNIISGNSQAGVAIIPPSSGTPPSTGNLVQGNFIGTDADGTSAMGNGHDGYVSISSDNIVGGSTASARNIISGNGRPFTGETVRYPGVSILSAPGNQVQNNYIGTDVTGTVPIGNDSVGVLVSGANSTTIKDNIISSNGSHGVSLGGFATDPTTGPVFGGTGATVTGNFIGTDSTGVRNLGNALDGIFVENSSSIHTIQENTIAFNMGHGVRIPNDASNTSIPGKDQIPANRILIGSNSIYGNKAPGSAPGIDLGEEGVTANHAKDPNKLEANEGQNFPELSSITNDGTNITIHGKLEKSAPNTKNFTIEFFSNTSSSGSGCVRQGQHPMQKIQVETDANGTAIINVVLPVAMAGGFINATATDPAGNTSEFSDCAQVSAARGPELIEITVTSNLVAVGSGFIKPVQVSILDKDSQGNTRELRFSEQAKLKRGTRVVQSGRVILPDGTSISLEEAVPPGKLVQIRFRNGNGAETVVPFKK